MKRLQRAGKSVSATQLIRAPPSGRHQRRRQRPRTEGVDHDCCTITDTSPPAQALIVLAVARARWHSARADQHAGAARRPSPTSCSSWATTSAGCRSASTTAASRSAKRPTSTASANEGATLHRLLRDAELHLRAQRLLHRHVPAAHRHDPAAAAGQPDLSAARHAGARASSCYDLGYTTGEFGKNHLGDHTDGAADGARLPGVLGLPLPPRRDAAGELPGHQQDRRPCRASRRRAGTRRSPASPRSPVPWTRRRRRA